MEKKCSRCKEIKPLDNFKSNNTYCILCQKDYQKHWHAKHKVRRNLAVHVRVEENNKKIREIKESSPCVDCGIFYPYYIMQFDHLDSSTKVGNIAAIRNYSLDKILEEIDKCELVCANCHSTRTFQRTKRKY